MINVSAEIKIPVGKPVKLTVSSAGKTPQRLVTARRGNLSHRDRINTDSSISRERFTSKLAAKLGIAPETLITLIDPNLTKLADQADEAAGASDDDGDDKKSQATVAANMAVDWDLWHTPGGDAFATVPLNDHDETWPLKSQTFKRYVAKQFFDTQGKAINSQSLSSAINVIESLSLFHGQEDEVHVRLAGRDGNIYLDLCNPNWQVVEITPSGWQVIGVSPVRFRRSRGMLPLPTPEKGGSVQQLRTLLNVDDGDWQLIVGWLIATLRPHGPYPVLALFAEQGSGKSTVGRLLRGFVDPNSAPLRSEPRNAHDLMITANNSWCLAYDNLSYIPPWLSDALCRLSSGGGFATRELYTDQDEIIFNSQRPVLLTSIEEVTTRSDLLDRCLIVSLPSIPEDQRRPEEEIDKAFAAARPRILGALLDAVVGALHDLPNTQMSTLPRKADFALWVTAAEKSLGWPTGTFMAAYRGNRDSANELALEVSAIGQPLLELLQGQGKWCGSATELLKTIEQCAPDQLKHMKAWPKNGRAMAGHLKRLAPNLRAVGWDVGYHRKSSSRTWVIRRMTQPSTETHTDAVQNDANHRKVLSDDADDANDANSQPFKLASEHNRGGWEEGEL